MGLPKFEDLTPEQRKIYGITANVMAFTITRKRLETGLTFSSDAFDKFLASINQYIGTRVMRHWEETGEPPTVMNVLVAVGVDHNKPEDIEPPTAHNFTNEALSLAEQVLKAHEQVAMDSPEDKALHAQACEVFRENIEALQTMARGEETTIRRIMKDKKP